MDVKSKSLTLITLLHVLLCSTTSGWMHSRYGLEKERLYSFWSSNSQNREVFLYTLSASTLSSGKMSSLRNRTIRSIQLSPNLSWWIWTFSLFTSAGLHRSSTKITRGRPCAEDVARVARESARVFMLLGIWCKEKESNLDCKCLAWFRYSYILTSLASNSPFT